MPKEVKETNENEEVVQTVSGTGGHDDAGCDAPRVLGKRKRHEYENSY
jgi:hypothetical protein